eukprot:747750-Hanusia_phi.AAC.1
MMTNLSIELSSCKAGEGEFQDTIKILRSPKATSGMSSPSKRREMDLMKLMMSDHEVQMVKDNMSEFNVKFSGPKDSETPYEGGTWKVHVELPVNYPYKSPSIGFVNRMYHPNVDEMYASMSSINPGVQCLVCDFLDTVFLIQPSILTLLHADLINVFEVFLPQLLTYPNPTDPLNGEAAALMIRDPEKYASKIKEYVQMYATDIRFEDDEDEDEEDEEDDDKEESGIDSDDDDDEPAGKMDED